MSNYKFWVATKEQLEDMLMQQNVYERLQPIEDRFTAHCFFANMYCDYINLVNRLGHIYHRTFQVQKRELIENLLQASTQRLLELREELKNVELSEFIYIDRTLKQRKLTPFSVQIVRPEYFPHCRSKEICNIIKNPRPPPPPTEEEMEAGKLNIKRNIPIAEPQDIEVRDKQTIERELREQEAVNLIQNHERLRMARIWQTNIHYDPKKYWPIVPVIPRQYEFTFKPGQEKLFKIEKTDLSQNYYKQQKQIRTVKFYEKPIIVSKSRSTIRRSTKNPEPPKSKGASITTRDSQIGWKQEQAIKTKLLEEAAQAHIDKNVKIIQRAWRKYCGRKIIESMKLREKIILGLIPSGKGNKCTIEQQNEEKYNICEKVLQFREHFEKACTDEKNRILLIRSDWIMEDISDQIRFWFKDFYDTHTEFHPFPDDIKGGTLLLLLNETMTHTEYAEFLKKPPLTKEQKSKLKEKAKAERKKQKELKKKEILKEKKMMQKIEAKGGVYYDMNKVLKTNKNTTVLKESMKEIKTKWSDVDEKAYMTQAPYFEWIKADKFAEVHKELRVIVDTFMRIEYELLRKALAKDKKRKYKPTKQKKPKKKRVKVKKEPPDLTADRSISSLYYEMEDSGLIRPYQKRCFEEFIGDLNYCAYDLKNYFELEVLPSTLEVRDILREWVFGLGPLNLAKKVKSICLAGSPQSGKLQLCEILATETDAIIIDLSPEIVVQYKDDMNFLVHLVNKMARILQPVIILIRNVHRVYWKKVPKDMVDLEPQLLQKFLLKRIVKLIKNDEKIFVIGTTNEPWSAKGTMKKVFEKILLLPQTTYASSYFLWKELTLKNFGIPRDFEFSPIAWVGRTYSSGKIRETIEKTLPIERRMKILRKPLKAEEFIETLIKNQDFPPEKEDFAKFIKWNNKTNKLAKSRVKYLKATQQKDSKNKTK